MGKNIGKNISKNLSGKHSQNFLDYAKQSATDALKTSSNRAIQNAAGATGNLSGNKISKVSKTSHQHNSETVTNENDKKMPKKKDIYLQTKDKKLCMI